LAKEVGQSAAASGVGGFIESVEQDEGVGLVELGAEQVVERQFRMVVREEVGEPAGLLFTGGGIGKFLLFSMKVPSMATWRWSGK